MVCEDNLTLGRPIAAGLFIAQQAGLASRLSLATGPDVATKGKRAPVAYGRKGFIMTQKQYLAALKALGLTPAGKATATALGLTLRQCQNLANGHSPIGGTLALLLRMYLKHGIPDDSA